jgi:hypothetical protein
MVLREIDASVEWQDRRFTDLEAEVEAEDVPCRRAFALLRTTGARYGGSRRCCMRCAAAHHR